MFAFPLAESVDTEILGRIAAVLAELHTQKPAGLRSRTQEPKVAAVFVSIFSLMRDGHDLAEALRGLRSISPEAERMAALSTAVQPYLEFVTEDAKCAHTGLLLRDVWRYFRHAWASPHKSIPGRTHRLSSLALRVTIKFNRVEHSNRVIDRESCGRR